MKRIFKWILFLLKNLFKSKKTLEHTSTITKIDTNFRPSEKHSRPLKRKYQGFNRYTPAPTQARK